MRIDADTLREMAAQLSADDRDEMAIPSFLHKNPALRWMAWRRIEVVAQPSGFDVRFLIDGRPRRKDGLDTAMGELVVKEFFAADVFTRLHVRARPRNTSFGAGAEVDV